MTMNLNPACPITSPMPVPDAALVASVLAGDAGAFAALVDRYQRAVIATCRGALRDRQLAEDAAQDAFVSAYRNLGSLRDPSSFGPWLLSIARNRSYRLARQRPRYPALAGDDPPAAAPRATDGPDEALLAALARLPDHERSVVMLRYFDNLDVAAIAAITNRPVGTVTKQLSRAHARLRKHLEREESR